MKLGEVINIHLEDNFIFAIAVGSDESGFKHCAIIYNWKDKIKVLDFYLGKIRKDCSYGDLGSKDYVYVKYNEDSIDYDFAIQIPSICESIIEKNNLLNFGITFNNSSFDKDGNLKLQKGDFGLTCSTFVMSIFESVGIPLVDFDTWENREDDLEWHKYVLNFFVEKNKEDSNVFSNDLIKHFEDNIGCFRYRPEEVASSTSFDVIPSSFINCQEHGVKLCEAIDNGVTWYNDFYNA